MAGRAHSRIEAVSEALESYARRGVFRGFTRLEVSRSQATFRLRWHRDRFFELHFDSQNNTLRMPQVLPSVPARSKMYRSLKEFIKSRHSAALPDHRRIDPRKAEVRTHNRAGCVSVTLTVKNGDSAYGARKLINLVHEIFVVFLADHYEYMVENLDLDPDHI